MDYFKQLDDILEFLDDGDRPHMSFLSIHRKFPDILKIHKERILDKLCRDGYAEEVNTFYKITYEGLIFLNYGGYTQQLKDIKSKRYHRNLLNIIVALGTGLAGLYALWMFCKGFLNLFGSCFYF